MLVDDNFDRLLVPQVDKFILRIIILAISNFVLSRFASITDFTPYLIFERFKSLVNVSFA